MQRQRVAAFSRALLILFAIALATPLMQVGAQAPANTDLEPGMTAIVRADGDCLRLRTAPGFDTEHIECINEGATVTILQGAQDVDGYHWRQIQWAGMTGWVADAYLRPYEGPPATGGSCADIGQGTHSAGFTGLYAGGGLSIAMWGGGNTAGMLSHSINQGCQLQSAWVSHSNGSLVGYLAGAPDFVNERWYDLFPGGDVPPGQMMIVRCSPVDGNVSQSASTQAPLTTASAPQLVGSEAPPDITATAAIVIDGASGAVLYERQAYNPLPPASITKILTAIMVIEGANLDEWVTSDVDGREMTESSLMGVRPGDCFTVRDLLYGLMLPSGNDAALVLARHMAGTDDAFVAQMNTRAQQLGLTGSLFTDPHGLGSLSHRMSAYDIAMLSRYAMTLPTFVEVVGTSLHTANGSRVLTLYNINTFMNSLAGADGVKTGYTSESGRTISASATQDGRRLFAVLLDAPDRDEDAAALLQWAFANHAW